uniref:Uncharacterized protein n=1 Tax=Aegilops tauschii subsp. strangulata TaxID=200361 RepID=A0A453NHS8_AEGTS
HDHRHLRVSYLLGSSESAVGRSGEMQIFVKTLTG